MQALEELDYLAALDDDGNLSEMGIIMSEIPLDPQMAKALLASCEFDCVSEMLTIAAMLSGTYVKGSCRLAPDVVASFQTLHWFLGRLAPSCFLEPPAGMSREVALCHRKLQHPEGDHFTLINIYNAFKRSQKERCNITASGATLS